jgi:predicted aspartyl protease
MKIRIMAEEPIIFFVRVKGPQGEREMRAVLDTGSVYSMIPVQDARQLGYDAYFDRMSMPDCGTPAVTKSDIIETDSIELEEVRVGNLVATNVKALTWDMPRLAGVEAILGLSFLKNFMTTLDYANNQLTIEPFWHDVHD